MKEAPTKNLPPKSYTGTVNGGTPVKNATNNNYNRAATSDEILSTLLRINNFDSISSIKDESLDIDLSACVTISSDPSGMINGNSLSSHDFWRVLDESAQNPGQLENNDYGSGGSGSNVSNFLDSAAITKNEGNNLPFLVKPESHSSFSGTFLRPEPPSLLSISPLKKLTKALPAEHLEKHHRKPKKTTTIGAIDQRLAERKKLKTVITPPLLVKQEPPEQLLADDDEESNQNKYSDNNKTANLEPLISKQNFNLFMPPVTTSVNSSNTNNNNNKSFVNQKSEVAIKAAPSSAVNANLSDACVANAGSVGTEEARPPTPEPLFKCENCGGLLLQGLQAYAMHEALSHKIFFKCNECEKDFDSEASLKKHIKTHRNMESRKDAWKKCPDCGKCLKLGSMWMHRKIHSDNKKYGCDICGQKFVQKINLTHHSRVHTSEKPYECPECQKRFQERSHLQRHQKYHAQTRSYRCEKCGKMYKTERCLKVHNLVHLEQRPFACNVCDKSFISNSKLKQHSNIHTGERPFKCNYCPRDFTNFPNWLKHTRRRHKVDHKTGEHLENIPSYCSKKSTKSAAAKAEKTQSSAMQQNASNEAAANVVGTVTLPDTGNTVVAKPQAKRKKKPAPPINEPKPAVVPNSTPNVEPTVASSELQQQPTAIIANARPVAVRVVKIKRERKQPTPKQVQKSATPAAVIKKEIIDCIELPANKKQLATQQPTAGTTNFPDLHCLSITSAEELIMEQALEMEECGLYDAPATNAVLDTDNAVSAESAAALHFKIKNEFVVVKEEFDTTSNRVLCSSLESSPFSSPASIEFSSSSVVPSGLATNTSTSTSSRASTQTSIATSAASFYMPSFRLNTGSIVNNLNLTTITNTPATATTTTTLTPSNGFSTHALLQSIQQQMPTHMQQEQRSAPLPSAQALLNHLYVPISMSMPLLMQPQLCTTTQVLPSVDTLLFTHANSHFFRGKSAAQATAHHNL